MNDKFPSQQLLSDPKIRNFFFRFYFGSAWISPERNSFGENENIIIGCTYTRFMFW